MERLKERKIFITIFEESKINWAIKGIFSCILDLQSRKHIKKAHRLKFEKQSVAREKRQNSPNGKKDRILITINFTDCDKYKFFNNTTIDI
mgnify:FL=1